VELVGAVRRAASRFAPAARALSRTVQRLEAVAHQGSAPSIRKAVTWV
jgi:hypothetical protein